LSARITDARCFLRRVYDISYVSDIHSPFLSDELPGRSSATVTDLRLQLSLVKATIRRVLAFDHLIESVNAVYSDDPEATYAIVCLLSSPSVARKAGPFWRWNSIKALSHDGLSGFEPRNSSERRLAEWVEFSLGILADEFEGKGGFEMKQTDEKEGMTAEELIEA
jgi:hypothetical protein